MSSKSRGKNIPSAVLLQAVMSQPKDKLGRVNGDKVREAINTTLGHEYSKATIKGRLIEMNKVLDEAEGYSPVEITWNKKVRATQKDSLLALLSKYPQLKTG